MEQTQPTPSSIPENDSFQRSYNLLSSNNLPNQSTSQRIIFLRVVKNVPEQVIQRALVRVREEGEGNQFQEPEDDDDEEDWIDRTSDVITGGLGFLVGVGAVKGIRWFRGGEEQRRKAGGRKDGRGKEGLPERRFPSLITNNSSRARFARAPSLFADDTMLFGEMKEEEVRQNEERRTSGAKRQQKQHTAYPFN